MIINVKNIKNNLKELEKPNSIYIGRYNKFYNLNSSILKNPFKIGIDGNREEVILKFKNYLLKEIKENKNKEIINELNRLLKILNGYEEINLFCYCSPEKCHGDILKDILEYLTKKGIKEIYEKFTL